MIKGFKGMKLEKCCMHLSRTWSETINGLYPPSNHSPMCKNYIQKDFYAVGVLDGGPRCIFATIEEVERFMDGDYSEHTVEKIKLTQDQFERLDEFEGF